MTIRFFKLPQFVVRFSKKQRRLMSLRGLSACAMAALLVHPAQAQMLEQWHAPASDSVVGTSVVAAAQANGGGSIAVDETAGVYVGPGGAKSSTDVPSALGPASVNPHTRYVNQPYANGPFVQNQPLYSESGGHVSTPCDVGCDVGYYGSVEALYFRRENDERFTLSQGSRIPPFDYEWGGRVTVGRLMDCVNGYEASYAGPFKWERERVQTGTNLMSKLTPVSLPLGSLSTFDNATVHSQRYEARLNTYEINRRWWAWDVFSTLIGIRVVDYREKYAFLSTNPAVGNGLYQDQTRNIMVGPQVGGDLMTPVGLRTVIGIKGKGAVLANFNRNQVALQNNGTTVIDASDSDVDVAGLIELGTYVKYSITPSIRVTAGYEVWYIPGVATIPGQNLRFVTPESGNRTFANDELLLHGATAGAQILF